MALHTPRTVTWFMRWILSLLIVVLVGLQYRLWVGPGSRAHIAALNTQIATRQEGNRQLSERNQRLQSEVIELKSGLDSVEERARSELGLIKKGETFFLYVDKPSGE